MKTVIVTGAAGGMGSALSKKLIAENYRVIALDHNTQRLDSLKADIHSNSLIPLSAEFSENQYLDRLEEIIAKEERIYGLVNMAAISHGDDIENISDEAWEKSLQVNLSTPMRLTRLVSTYMKEMGGSIVNVTSPVGFIGARKVSYAASKAGLLGLTMTCARNLGKYNIRCNLIIPGTCITYMTGDWPKEKRDSVAKESFLGRLCETNEIANAIHFLLSEQSSYMTGATLDLTAGAMLGH